MDQQRSVVADLHPLDVLRTILPGEPRLPLEQLASQLVGHPVDVVRPRNLHPLRADATVVTPLSHYRDVLVEGECLADGLNNEPRNGHELVEQRAIDLEGLGREVEQPLDHVASEEDDALIDCMVMPL